MRHHLFHRTGIGLGIRERCRQAHTVESTVAPYIAVGVSVRDGLFAPGVDQEANQIRTHVVTAKVCEGLGQMGLIEVDLNLAERANNVSELDVIYLDNMRFKRFSPHCLH